MFETSDPISQGAAFVTLKLYYPPLSSYSWKALIAAYELGVAFEGVVVDEATRV